MLLIKLTAIQKAKEGLSSVCQIRVSTHRLSHLRNRQLSWGLVGKKVLRVAPGPRRANPKGSLDQSRQEANPCLPSTGIKSGLTAQMGSPLYNALPADGCLTRHG